MKKLILLLLWSVLSFGQASNEMVTFTQAQSLGFTLNPGQSHVTSNQCMTKSEALAKYNLSTSAMDGYASNQLVPRSAWVTAVVSYIYYGDMTGYSTRALACQNSTNHSLYYSPQSFVQSGMTLFHDSNLTQPFVGNGQYYSIYPDNVSPTITSGTINSIGSYSNIVDCVPQNEFYVHEFTSVGSPNGYDACFLLNYNLLLYSIDEIIGNGSVLYTDAALTTLYNGSNVFRHNQFTGDSFKINNSGLIIDTYLCQ